MSPLSRNALPDENRNKTFAAPSHHNPSLPPRPARANMYDIEEVRRRHARQAKELHQQVVLSSAMIVRHHLSQQRLQAAREKMRVNVFDLPPAPRSRGIKRTARYANVPDAQGQPRKGRDLWDRKWSETSYWREYLNLKPANYYDAHPDEDKVFRDEFEHKMRMPLHLFQQLVDEMQRELPPEREPCVPLKVKLAASLRFLALGCAWDGIEDIFNVSRVVLSDWYKNKFLPFMMRPGGHFERNVRIPSTVEEVADLARMYEGAGFPGCIGSMDGVQVIWNGCPAGQQYAFKGWKEKHPTLNFNVTVDFNGMPIHVGNWFSGSTNDKLMLHDDAFHHALLTDPLFTDFRFTCMSGEGEPIPTSGAYIICDNGYADVPTMQRPMKYTLPSTIAEAWSKHVESVRKDVECFFGIMKGTFRILKTGIFFRSVKVAEDTFKVCCALRRMIFDANGSDGSDPMLHQRWKQMDDVELASMKEGSRREPQEAMGREEDARVSEGAMDEAVGSAAQMRARLMHHFHYYKTYRSEQHARDVAERRQWHALGRRMAER